MPYNSTAIPPTDEITGSASLPLSRIKRILSLDPEITACSASASFTITIATELFIRHLTSSAATIAKASNSTSSSSSRNQTTTSGGAGISKPRRNLQYRDFSAAVSRIDNLEFLSDVIPRTTTYKEYKAQRAVRTAKSRASRAVSGNADSGVGSAQQMTLDGKTGVPIRPAVAATAVPPPAGGVSEEMMETEEGLELVQNGEINNVGGKQREDVRDEDDTPTDVPAPEGPRDGLVFEHYKPNGEGASSGSRVQAGEDEEDVEMG